MPRKQPSPKLVELAIYASLIRAGAKVLGGDAAVRLFESTLTDALSARRWPVAEASMQSFITKALSAAQPRDDRYAVDTALGQHLRETTNETAAYVQHPESLKELETALELSLRMVTQAYGYPLLTAGVVRSPLRDAFDAAKTGNFDVKLAALNHTTEMILNNLGQFGDGTIGREFWTRVFGKLEKKGWPIGQDNGLAGEVMKMVSASPNLPGPISRREFDRETDYVLTHISDLRAAANEAFDQLTRENTTTIGVDVTQSVAARKYSLN